MERGAAAGIEVRLSAPVYPTESAERVSAAITALFPTATVTTEGNRVLATLPDASVLGDVIQRQRIPDTARGQLMRGRTGERCVVFLGKQAAAGGRLNFAAVPGPLGDVRLEIVAPGPEALDAFIGAAAPDTTVETYQWPKGRDPDLDRAGGPYSKRPEPGPQEEE